MVSDAEKPYYSTGPWTVGYEFIIKNLSFLSLGICLQIKPTNSFAVSFLRKHFVIRECNLMDTHAYIHYTTAVHTIPLQTSCYLIINPFLLVERHSYAPEEDIVAVIPIH